MHFASNLMCSHDFAAKIRKFAKNTFIFKMKC